MLQNFSGFYFDKYGPKITLMTAMTGKWYFSNKLQIRLVNLLVKVVNVPVTLYFTLCYW